MSAAEIPEKLLVFSEGDLHSIIASPLPESA